MRKNVLAGIVVTILLSTVVTACGPARSREPKTKQVRAPRTVEVRYLVKLTPSAWEFFEKKNLRRVVRPEELPVEALKAVSEARKISYWKPVYPEIIVDDPVGLSRMYLLAADEETSIKETVQAFEALSDWIEYIEVGGDLDD